MSGGPYDYIFCRLNDAADYAQNKEVQELLWNASVEQWNLKKVGRTKYE